MHALRLAAAAIALLAACVSEPLSSEQQTLETNRQRFEAAVPSSYAFDYRRSCECLAEDTAPMRIAVSAGAITGAFYLADEAPVPAAVIQRLPTVADVFDTIEAAVVEGAHSIVVDYDDEAGFPASVAIDYSPQIADEEYSVWISNLTPDL